MLRAAIVGIVLFANLGAWALPTPVVETTEKIDEIKQEAWGVVLPEPDELLLDVEEGEVIMDTLDEDEPEPVPEPTPLKT